MERYTIQQRVEINKMYYQNQCSVRQTFCALRPIYDHRSRPAESAIRRLVHKFETTGSVADEAMFVCQKNSRSLENVVLNVVLLVPVSLGKLIACFDFNKLKG